MNELLDLVYIPDLTQYFHQSEWPTLTNLECHIFCGPNREVTAVRFFLSLKINK